ncbi:MAG: hypothetical protein KIT79_01970 [Deltaproteobacteria bacterium]|nr:hypothetical protein [Deltaproteobacteria bacterium]
MAQGLDLSDGAFGERQTVASTPASQGAVRGQTFILSAIVLSMARRLGFMPEYFLFPGGFVGLRSGDFQLFQDELRAAFYTFHQETKVIFGVNIAHPDKTWTSESWLLTAGRCYDLDLRVGQVLVEGTKLAPRRTPRHRWIRREFIVTSEDITQAKAADLDPEDAQGCQYIFNPATGETARHGHWKEGHASLLDRHGPRYSFFSQSLAMDSTHDGCWALQLAEGQEGPVEIEPSVKLPAVEVPSGLGTASDKSAVKLAHKVKVEASVFTLP